MKLPVNDQVLCYVLTTGLEALGYTEKEIMTELRRLAEVSKSDSAIELIDLAEQRKAMLSICACYMLGGSPRVMINGGDA